jgi:hypothetical protein
MGAKEAFSPRIPGHKIFSIAFAMLRRLRGHVLGRHLCFVSGRMIEERDTLADGAAGHHHFVGKLERNGAPGCSQA